MPQEFRSLADEHMIHMGTDRKLADQHIVRLEVRGDGFRNLCRDASILRTGR